MLLVSLAFLFYFLLFINKNVLADTTTTTINTTTTTVPTTNVCRPCDWTQLAENEPSQYFMTGMCLIANLFACNSLLFALVLIFILVIGTILMFKKRLFG